jgi:hypothetical protein
MGAEIHLVAQGDIKQTKCLINNKAIKLLKCFGAFI